MKNNFGVFQKKKKRINKYFGATLIVRRIFCTLAFESKREKET